MRGTAGKRCHRRAGGSETMARVPKAQTRSAGTSRRLWSPRTVRVTLGIAWLPHICHPPSVARVVEIGQLVGEDDLPHSTLAV